MKKLKHNIRPKKRPLFGTFNLMVLSFIAGSLFSPIKFSEQSALPVAIASAADALPVLQTANKDFNDDIEFGG